MRQGSELPAQSGKDEYLGPHNHHDNVGHYLVASLLGDLMEPLRDNHAQPQTGSMLSKLIPTKARRSFRRDSREFFFSMRSRATSFSRSRSTRRICSQAEQNHSPSGININEGWAHVVCTPHSQRSQSRIYMGGRNGFSVFSLYYISLHIMDLVCIGRDKNVIEGKEKIVLFFLTLIG